MTIENDLDEILRRAMHAAVDSVEPAGDGLQQIRRQLARPRLRLQAHLLLTETTDLIRLIGIRLGPAASSALGLLRRLWTVAAAAVQPPGVPAGTASGRPRHEAAHRSQPPGRMAGTIAWLRPAVAVGAAVVIVVAGVFTLFTLRQTISPISLLTGGGQSPPASQSVGPGARQSGTPSVTVTSPGSTPHTKNRVAMRHVSPAPSCTPAGPAGSPATSPSPTAEASPTGTPTATPSPTDTTSPSPAGSGTAAPVNSVPPAGVGAGGGPVQLTSGCYGTRKTASPAP